MLKKFIYPLLIIMSVSHVSAKNNEPIPEFWKNATLRGFEGGDIRGIINKIESGYFTDLGVDALWMTPLIEQIHGYDTSAGLTYAYHGYWPKDWTAVDANYGTEADLKEMIATAHQHGIKILLYVVLNHTGPETQQDWAWPPDWVRTHPICDWSSFAQNSRCALATSLTDIKTESEQAVELPPERLQKWQREGRKERELAELDAFFKRTGYPRAPKYYLVKWLTDWVKEYGVDGFRVDTVKHVEADIWKVLKKESQLSFNSWKINNPEQVMDDLPFYMVGEVFNWGVNGFANTVKDSAAYDYGDELARPLFANKKSDAARETVGDANLRTFMNWDDLQQPDTRDLLAHWQKLGKFRQQHDAVGSGIHEKLSDTPYVFKRTLGEEVVIVAKDLPVGAKPLHLDNSYANDTRLYDYYSQQEIVVKDNKVTFSSNFSYALIAAK